MTRNEIINIIGKWYCY